LLFVNVRIIFFFAIRILVWFSRRFGFCSIHGGRCSVDGISISAVAGNSDPSAKPRRLFRPNCELLSLIKILLMFIVEHYNLVRIK
jgi:hypothetical protein